MSLILVPDDADFDIAGPIEWEPDGWDLDRCIIPYRGPYSALETFLAGRAMWSTSGFVGDVYLADYGVDDHKQFPTVRLVYKGKRGGVLPPDRNRSGYTVSQARASSFPSGKTFITVTYLAPTSSKRVWSRSAIDIGTISPATPADVTVIDYLYRSDEGISFTGDPLDYFAQKETTLGESEEVIPLQYFVADVTKQNLLYPYLT